MPQRGGSDGGTLVTAVGNAFADFGGLGCTFGDLQMVDGTLIDATRVVCRSPQFRLNGSAVTNESGVLPASLQVGVSLNGDPTSVSVDAARK